MVETGYYTFIFIARASVRVRFECQNSKHHREVSAGKIRVHLSLSRVEIYSFNIRGSFFKCIFINSSCN